MAYRPDQLQSYQFTVQRVVAAIVTREADPAVSPFRRVAAGTLAGLLLAALSLAAVAVYGVLAPGGGTAWKEPGAVIIDRDSGARYVYLAGQLHPVLNYASALLIVEAGAAHTVSVAGRTIAGVPRGAPLGIPGAPDSLPAPGALLGGAWTVCSTPESVLYVGLAPAGDHPLADGGVLARTPDGRLALIWHGHRYPIPRPAVVRAAFGWANQVPVPVAPALANGLPPGPDLAPPAIPGDLGAASAVPDRPVGTVLVIATQGGARQYVVALPTGLAPISQVQADLLLSDPAEVRALGQRRAQPMAQGDFTLAPVAALPAPAVELPESTPALVRPSSLCVGSGPVTVDAAGSVVPHAGPGAGVDRIAVPPGRGALVRAMTSPGATGGALFLVTDLGVRYPVPDADVAARLGYGASTPVAVPAPLVALLPAGRVLDPVAARTPAGVTD